MGPAGVIDEVGQRLRNAAECIVHIEKTSGRPRIAQLRACIKVRQAHRTSSTRRLWLERRTPM